MFKNHKCKYKEKCRNDVFKLVKHKAKQKLKSRIFTLPSTNFKLEERILNNIPCQIITAENKKEIFKVQKKNNPGSKSLILNHGDAFKVLEKYNNYPFDVVWLDLCGPLSFNNVNNFLSFIQTGNLSNNSYVCITFACRRETQSKDITDFYGLNSIDEFRKVTFPKLVKEFAKMANRKTSLIKKFYYKSEEHTKSMPMQMLTFKINTK